MNKDNQPNHSESHNLGTDYGRKLKSGIGRLKQAIQAQYAHAFPNQFDSIKRAIAEAETMAWSTPFPSLFFPPLARIRIHEIRGQVAGK
jgi:hypothetical protein